MRPRQAVQRGPKWTKERDAVTTKLNHKIATVQCLNVQRGSFTHYNPVVTPRTLPSAGRSTKWDTHHNIGRLPLANPHQETKQPTPPKLLATLPHSSSPSWNRAKRGDEFLANAQGTHHSGSLHHLVNTMGFSLWEIWWYSLGLP